MRITRLRLTDFKAHDELEIEPAAGLTVIRGPNEAGKSSLQQALELALFRKPDANRQDVRRAWAWGSEAPPVVELDFEVEGESEGEAGTMRKCFGGSRAEGELTLGGRTIRDYQAIQDELAAITGVPSDSFYRATASVSHADLGAVDGAEAAIGDRLQKAVSGADRGTAKAKKKLEIAIRRYRTAGQVNPGLLKVADTEIEGLERDLAEGEAALRELESDRAAWVEADERRADLERRLAREQAELAEAVRAEDLVTRRDEAERRYRRLRRATQLITERERLEAALPGNLQLAQVREAVARLGALEFEISELEADVATTREAAAGAAPEPVPPRPVGWLGAAIALVAVSALLIPVLHDTGVLGLLVVAVIGLGVLVTLVQAARLAGRRRRYGLAMKLAQHAMAQHEESARRQEEELRRRRREHDQLLGSLAVSDEAGARAALEAAEQASDELARIEGELRGLGIDEHNPRRLIEARDLAADELDQARHALAALGSLAEEPIARRAALERQVAQTVPARDAARSEADQAQGRVTANAVDAELVADLAERLAAKQEHRAELRQRVAVYEATLAAIEAAEQATLKTAARYLEERMGPVISTITDGRYDEVEVDESSLAFKVRAPESGELVDADQLSQGTADQLFLAARLGLVRLVTLERRPPLILDDPFVTFDAGRAERALRLVRDLSHEQGFQVLYLTCSSRFDRLADELVVLPGPSDERVLAQPRAPKPAARPRASVARPKGAPELPAHAREAAQPTLTFAPDPRPNPDPVAPRRTEASRETSAAEAAFLGTPEEHEPLPTEATASGRLAALRAARAERSQQDKDGPDPVSLLREVVQDEEEARD